MTNAHRGISGLEPIVDLFDDMAESPGMTPSAVHFQRRSQMGGVALSIYERLLEDARSRRGPDSLTPLKGVSSESRSFRMGSETSQACAHAEDRFSGLVRDMEAAGSLRAVLNRGLRRRVRDSSRVYVDGETGTPLFLEKRSGFYGVRSALNHRTQTSFQGKEIGRAHV
mgnify:CR=1 FL=1